MFGYCVLELCNSVAVSFFIFVYYCVLWLMCDYLAVYVFVGDVLFVCWIRVVVCFWIDSFGCVFVLIVWIGCFDLNVWWFNVLV